MPNPAQNNCVICGQVVEIKGFTLMTKAGEKSFCCAGCQRIFQLFNEELLIKTPQPPNKK